MKSQQNWNYKFAADRIRQQKHIVDWEDGSVREESENAQMRWGMDILPKNTASRRVTIALISQDWEQLNLRQSMIESGWLEEEEIKEVEVEVEEEEECDLKEGHNKKKKQRRKPQL